MLFVCSMMKKNNKLWSKLPKTPAKCKCFGVALLLHKTTGRVKMRPCDTYNIYRNGVVFMKSRNLRAVIICVLLMALILGACSAPDSAPAAPAPATPAAPAAPAASAPPPPMDMFENDLEAEIWQEIIDMLAEEEEAFFGVPIITPSDESGRLMVYNVQMRLQTSDFMRGWRLILDTVGEMGGYFPHTIHLGDDMRRDPTQSREAFFRIRIPTENLAEFLLLIEQNYNIWRFEKTAEDEIMTYRRTDYALQGMREDETRLAQMLDGAEETEEILDLQSQLAALRNSIANMEISQDQLMDAVIYSTVIIELYEAFAPYVAEELPPLTFGEQMREALSGSLSFLSRLAQSLAIFAVVVLLPMLVIAVIVLICIRLVNKMRRSKKMAKFLSGRDDEEEV